MIRSIKKILKLYLFAKKSPYNKNTKKCYIMMAADYGNMGDIAITEAQSQFLKQLLSDYKIVEVPLSKIHVWAYDIRKKINNNDIITIVGGGNSGNIYLDFEQYRRFIVKYFKNRCKIISFPQTVDYSDDNNGKKELNKSINIYKKSNIVFFARELNSYEFYKKNFINKVFVVPDIVLSLNYCIKNKTDAVTLCIRNDKELANKSFVEKVEKYIRDKFTVVQELDTHIGDVKITKNIRKKTLYEFLDKFGSSKLVLTNRLHGMIFCAITGTPCIALDNSNHKVKNVYNDWLKKYKYIRVIDEDNFKNIDNIISDILRVKITSIPNIKGEYDDLVKSIVEDDE